VSTALACVKPVVGLDLDSLPASEQTILLVRPSL